MRDKEFYQRIGKLGTQKAIENGTQTWQKRHRDTLALYQNNPKSCLFCNIAIPYEKRKNKFCSHSCAAAHNNKGVRRHGENPGNCLYCNIKLSQYGRKYCSMKCQYSHEWLERKKQIELDQCAPNEKIGKKYLLRTHGNRCMICGITEWMNKSISMIIDHINGNSEDNSLQNLRLICGNCDMQTDTYKSKNLGNGRYSRRVRYAEGKSY